MFNIFTFHILAKLRVDWPIASCDECFAKCKHPASSPAINIDNWWGTIPKHEKELSWHLKYWSYYISGWLIQYHTYWCPRSFCHENCNGNFIVSTRTTRPCIPQSKCFKCLCDLTVRKLKCLQTPVKSYLFISLCLPHVRIERCN